MNIKLKLLNKLESLHFEFRKFFASNVLGKKYIRTGKCKACGKCCDGINIKRAGKMLSDREEFEELKKQHYFYNFLNVVGESDFGLVFECKKLDKEKGICTAYHQRALLCREYPNEAIFMMGGTIGKNCGFEFTPIKTFDEVFSSIKKKSDKKNFKFILDDEM
ncbi:MAG: YkgJ family cysteine cluster protein [bacterium]